MSFKELTGDYVATENEFTVEHKGKKYTFTAHKVPYLDALAVAASDYRGKNAYAVQISRSIRDQDGEHMTYEQAMQLPDEIAQKFMEESGKVNKREAEVKN